jgi:hypothetical protein
VFSLFFQLSQMPRSLTVLLIIPTGIKAAIGGYAGDALPVARAIAAVADTLITHPNVLNGASLFYPMANVLYVEGYGLDQLALGNWGLKSVHSNRIGVILDRAIEPDLALRHHQAIAAAKATLGLTITDIITTDQNLGVELQAGKSGATWGTIANPDSLLRAADKLVNVCKVQAIAVITRFPDDTDSAALQDYRQGQGVDALAGAEAVISHLIVREFGIPCAHAPALSPLPLDPTVSPRAAAEELGYTFLPCVLVGLSRSPQFVDIIASSQPSGIINRANIDVVIIPESACGGAAMLALNNLNHIHTIFVRENTTALKVYPQLLGLKGITVHGYLEAIGVLAAIKAGVNPQSLRIFA